jgi:hypothetical protein
MSGRVCHLLLLLALASAVILESHGTHDHILLSQIRDSPNLEGYVPVFISPRNSVAQLYPQVKLLVLVMQPQQGPHRKRFFHYSVFSCCQGNNVFTELFPSKWLLRCLLSPVYTADIWQWVYMSPYKQNIN